MNKHDVNWRGNICAIITPFNRDGSLDERSYRENIRNLVREGVDGVVVAGDTGEFWALSHEERFRLFALAKEEAGGKVVVGNASAMTTGESIFLARAALERGLDGIMLTPPFYVRPGEREVVAHFQAVSDAVPIPIMMYNLPSRVGIAMSTSLMLKLCDVDNVVAIKQSSPAFGDVMETIRLAGDKIWVLAGHSVDRGFPCVVMGADGYVSSVEPQVMGREAAEMYRLALEGNLAQGARTQLRCIELDHAVHGAGGTFPASLKAAMNLLGRPGGYPRKPLLYPSEEQLKALKETLAHLGLLEKVR